MTESGALQVTVGIDVGGTKIYGVVATRDGAPLGDVQRPTPAKDPAQFTAALCEVVDTLVGQLDGAMLQSIGVGLPGFLSLDGIAAQAPNLPAVVGLDVGTLLRERFGVPVRLDNDANCAAWAARAADAPDVDHVVAITLGTGIGGGFIVNGELLRGGHGFAGEPGHVVVQRNGLDCVCGQRGCWEMYASGTALGRQARNAVAAGRGTTIMAAANGVIEDVDAPLIGRLALTGDHEAGAVLDTYVGWLVAGLVTVINTLDPEVVLIGGGVVDVGDALFSRIDRELLRYPSARRGRSVEIRPTSLGPAAGGVGAALLAWQSLAEPVGAHR